MSLMTGLLLFALFVAGLGLFGYGYFAGLLLRARIRARQQAAGASVRIDGAAGSHDPS